MFFASFSYSHLSFILSMCVSMSGCKFKCKCLCQAKEWKRTNLQQIIYRMGNNKTSVEWNVVGIIVRFWYLPLEFWTLKTDGSTRHNIAVIPQQLMSTIIISAVATADFVNQKGRETKQFSKKTFSRTIDTSLRTHTYKHSLMARFRPRAFALRFFRRINLYNDQMLFVSLEFC